MPILKKLTTLSFHSHIVRHAKNHFAILIVALGYLLHEVCSSAFLRLASCPALFREVGFGTAQVVVVLEELFPVVLPHGTALAGVAALFA